MDCRGKRVNVKARNMHGVRHNVFAAMSSDGLCAMEVFRSNGNLETLMYFLRRHLIPVMHPFPMPNSVLLLDNARIHHASHDLLTRVCRAYGIKVLFVPPYSPDMNPIELMFGVVKSHIAREYRQLRDAEHPHEEIRCVFREVGTWRNAHAWMRKCGYM